MRTFCALIVATLIGACGGRSAANDANFTRAVDEFLAVNGVQCWGATHYPSRGGNDEHLLPDAFFEAVGDVSLDLTPAGRQHFVEGKGFCLGVPKVKLITNFSKPSAAGPYIASEVVYEYEIDSIPGWAREARMIRQGILRRSDRLILTRDGWVHEDLFRQ